MAPPTPILRYGALGMALSDLDRWNRKQAAYVRRKALREQAIAYLGGKCRICGYDKCAAALDVHHTDPMGKEFNISAALTSWARILPELEKCELLCCRCHREVHDGDHPGFLELDPSHSASQYDMGWEDELEEFNS